MRSKYELDKGTMIRVFYPPLIDDFTSRLFESLIDDGSQHMKLNHYIQGLSLMATGSTDDIYNLFVKMFDFNKDSKIDKEDLISTVKLLRKIEIYTKPTPIEIKETPKKKKKKKKKEEKEEKIEPPKLDENELKKKQEMDAKREKEEKEAERLKELEIINNRANEIYDQVKGKDENISTKKFIKWMKKEETITELENALRRVLYTNVGLKPLVKQQEKEIIRELLNRTRTFQQKNLLSG